MSTEEVRYSVLLAFENLTEQSGSAAFRYMGQTTRQQMPLPPNPPANPDVGTLPACQSANIDYNLVSVLQTGPGGIGVYHARCRPHSTASGTKFEIHTYRNNTNWAIGSASTGWDLVHNWLHEGLHSLNLPHPTSNTMGASVQTSGNLGANRRVIITYRFGNEVSAFYNNIHKY